MNIPEEAIDAAMEAILKHGGTPGYVAKRFAKDALEAALPHLEATLRKQIANDPGYYAITYISGSTWNNALYHVIEQAAPSERRGAWHSAARIAEEGTTK